MSVTKRIWELFPAALLVICTALIAWVWYREPARAMAWGIAMLLVAGMAITLIVADRRAARPGCAPRLAREVRRGIVFAGLMVVFAMCSALATSPGAADLSQRVSMAIAGASLVFTGNMIPKKVTPLPAHESDAARVQALRRFAGWTWVLAGTAVSIAWLVLPIGMAPTASMMVAGGGLLAVAAHFVWSRRTRQREA